MGNDKTEVFAVPEWTEYRKKGGLDPLGMQNSSVNLYQRLLPGISNVTLRVRYYGFYAWLAALYAKRSGNTDPRNWQKFVRRSEALYALAARRRGGEGGIAGIQWAQRTLAANSQGPIDFSANADPGGEGAPYLRQAWGAYGAAYASQLFEVGVFATATGHIIPVPSPALGDGLADSFSQSIGPLEERFYSAIESAVVSVEDLDAFAPMTPTGIAENSRERELYQRMLFAEDLSGRPQDISRKHTLMLLLESAAHLRKTPDVPSARWLLYAGMDGGGDTMDLAEPLLAAQRERWWTYQANDLLQVGYETLLKFCLEILEAYPDGITLNALLVEAVGTLSEAAGAWPATWRTFLAQAAPAPNANDASDAASERAQLDVISKGFGPRKKTSPEAAWLALRLIGVVENRVRERSAAVKTELGHLNREGFHSLATELDFLLGQSDREFTLAVTALIEQRVLKRHLWVAHRKLRFQGDYTFLIESDDGRVRQRADSGPTLTNPRLGPAMTFLKDIHLLDGAGITMRGLQALGRA